MSADDTEDRRVGLCTRCVFMRRVPSSRGTTFYRCELSNLDVRFPKYPRLPVVQCAGFTPAADDDSATP
jgi:hypothetical protein